MLSSEQVVRHYPDGRSKKHNERSHREKDQTYLAAGPYLSRPQLVGRSHHRTPGALHHQHIRVDIETRQ